MPDEYQKELFEEFKKEKGKFKKIADKITQRQPKFYIHIALENIIFAVIIGIMCIVVAFALGVERGKKLPATVGVKEEEPLPEEKIVVSQIETAPPEREVATAPQGGFAIQLISYARKELAEKEKKKLLNKKIDAFIIHSGKWYQVCAGRYSDIKEAEKALAELKKAYKGCFIRR